MHGVRAYLLTFAALIALTTGTLLLSFETTGPGGVAVAFVIATIKGLLVTWFFMHMREEPAHSRFAFLSGVLFAVLLASLVVTDVAFRITPEVHVPARR